MSVADVLIHVDENLDSSQKEDIIHTMREIPGVISPRFNPGKEHMLLVAFNPAETKSTDLLTDVRSHGVHAELIGL
jgi:hypothetical protein